MKFKIETIVLWPKNSNNKLVKIDFELDKVNVITGGSSRGKSALLSIVDYCLASGTCRIPTRTIRDKTEWFGIVIRLADNNKILLARREPGEESVSNEMFMRESSQINVPPNLESNIRTEQVKARLNGLAGLSSIDFDESLEEVNQAGFKSRPSFRDLVAFNFQPQHLIANQSTLFYKTDIFQHREKLRTIFPYVLGAVDDNYLRKKEELKDLRREALSLQKERDRRKKMVDKWIGELRSNYVRAIELGLLPNALLPEETWSSQVYITYLKTIPKNFETGLPTISEGVSARVANRINDLEQSEITLSHKLNAFKNRYEVIKRLENSNREYQDSLLRQNDKLKGIDWFADLLKDEQKCPVCQSTTSNARLTVEKLKSSRNDILGKGARLNDNYVALYDETEKLRNEILQKEREINSIRREIQTLQGSDKIIETRYQNLSSIIRFAGNLEVEIKNYEEFSSNNDLDTRFRTIGERISQLEATINEGQVETKLRAAKRKIEDAIKFYAQLFQAEYSTDFIQFDEKDLTLSFISSNGRANALYEIGSGANYLAYHISTLLALHEFFQAQKTSPIPGFIIFDQPTQVYFPDKSEDEKTKDEDVAKVYRIFQAFSKCLERTKNGVQIIVIEHVGEYAWTQFPNVTKLKRWRGEDNDAFLIPKNWE